MLAGPPPTTDDLLSHDFVPAPGTDGANLAGVGHLIAIVRPTANDFTHPGGAWQEQHLAAAVRAALDRQRHRFNNIQLTSVFSRLGTWKPWHVVAWTAGDMDNNASPHYPSAQFGATMTYPARLSFQARWGLGVTGAWASQADQVLYQTAREFEVIRDLTAFLAIAGEYFSEVNGAGLLVAAARLGGFVDARSECDTDSAPAVHAELINSLPGAPDGVEGVARASALALRDTPEWTARALIERWLPQFYRDKYGRDAFDLVVAGTT